MCGRFTQQRDAAAVADRFGVQGTLFEPTPRYNVAPTQAVAAVTPHGPRQERLLEPLRWGLVPFWARDPAIGNKLINARSETVLEKPSFRHAMAKRRCLIPADGFYEWERATRQPYHFHLRGGPLFAFAGLYDEWTAPDGSPLRTCTILTTQANELVGRIHDRMPVILHPADEAAWLDVARFRPADLLPLLAPYPAEEMEATAVSKRVGSPAFDDPELVAPVAPGA